MIEEDQLPVLCSYFIENLTNFPEDALKALRSIRNLCASEILNTNDVIHSGIVAHLSRFCRALVLPTVTGNTAVDGWTRTNKSLVFACCQLLANLTCGKNIHGITYLWSDQVGESLLRDILAAVVCSQHQGAMGAFIAFIYNSVAGESEICTNSMNKFCSWRSLSSQLLLGLFNSRAAVQTLNPATDLRDGPWLPSNPAEEWMHMLVYSLLLRGRCVQWLLSIGPRRESEEVWCVSAAPDETSSATDNEQLEQRIGEVCGLTIEQVFAIQLISEVLEDPACGTELLALSNDASKLHQFSLLLHLLEQFILVAGVGRIVNLNGESTALQDDNENDFTRTAISKELLQSSVPLLLQSVASGLALLHTSERVTGMVRSDLAMKRLGECSNSFLQQCIRILAYQCQLDAQLASIPSLATECSRISLIVNTTLQLIGNLLVGSSEVQDRFRVMEGLPLVLHLSSTDVTNPLRREWALLCVRNACGNNEANQEYINRITLQKVEVVNQTMRESGISVDVDPVSGKVQFVQSSDVKH